jgi:subtilisin family serine protease
VTYPARYQGVLAVAGVDRHGKHADFSVTGTPVVLSAPAVDIVSTGLLSENGGYRASEGTSDATAIIAGAAALVRSRFPQLSATEVVHRLTATADDKGPPGRDDLYGYGVVNLVKALTADVPPLQTPTTPPAATPTTSTTNTTSGQHGGTGVVLIGVLLCLLLGAAGTTWILVRRARG